MTYATTKLLSVVSEAGGGPWTDSPGLTEDLLSECLGIQEDRGDGLRDTVVKKQGELARMEEVREDEFLGDIGNGQSTGQAPHTLRTLWQGQPRPGHQSTGKQGPRSTNPRAGQGRRRKPAPRLPGSPNTGEATREWREGRKGAVTARLLMPFPNVNERKNKAGG